MDRIVEIGSSSLHHGDENGRVYIMKLHRDDEDEVLKEAERLAYENGYGKLIAKVPESMAERLRARGFELEAKVPGLYGGSEDGFFMSRFLKEERAECLDMDSVKAVLDIAKLKTGDVGVMDERYKAGLCVEADSEAMASLYREVFESYPFPIFDPEYIRKTMLENVRYYGIWHKGRLVALSSSEMDERNHNTEMTDFATHPNYRGKSLSQILLGKMEADMAKRGIKTAYTIARAKITGINVIFSKMGYAYSGTLINNTNIGGSIESMNVWYKSL
jgi:beta-lysine N6-acetyltransferase